VGKQPFVDGAILLQSSRSPGVLANPGRQHVILSRGQHARIGAAGAALANQAPAAVLIHHEHIQKLLRCGDVVPANHRVRSFAWT
jgi:hypothetical protein